MKKNKILPIISFAILFMSMMLMGSVYAAVDYDAKIESANQKREALEKSKKELQNEIDELEKDKHDVMKYIEKLDLKMEKVTGSIEELKNKIEKKNTQLKKTEQELTQAEEMEKKQYDAMKKRIKYMYEHGNSEYIDLVFEADNLSDLLNRSEYISKISEYDQNMFERYVATRKSIDKKKNAIEDTLEELTYLKEEADVRKQALVQLTANKTTEVERYNQSIKQSNKQQQAYENELEKQEEIVENLLLEKQKQIEREEAARRARLEEERKLNGGDATENVDQYSGAKGLRWPLRTSGRITSYFGSRKSPTAGASSNHKGIDIAIAQGTPIVASGDGRVVTSTYSSGAGNYIMLYHGSSTYTVYMHCSKLNVSVGTEVKKGDVIGTVGSTGVSTGNHLHFGVMINGSYVNPLLYVTN